MDGDGRKVYLINILDNEPTFLRLFYSFHFFIIIISNFFGLSTTEETLLVEMRIWCIKIGIVLVLHWIDRQMCIWRTTAYYSENSLLVVHLKDDPQEYNFLLRSITPKPHEDPG
jgi:hypothetical protein